MDLHQIDKIFSGATELIRGELRYALGYLSANRLLESAKWAGELLVSLPAKDGAEKMVEGKSLPRVYVEELNEASDILGLARALFDLREYRKCIGLLKPFASPKYQCAMFLYYYASYLLSEQNRAEEIYENGEAINRSMVINKELIAIENELKGFYEKDELDAINLYLYGVILKGRGNKDQAKEALIKSICKFPLIWSAWLELSSLISKTDKTLFQKLPDCWVLYFFYASFYLEIHQETDCITAVTQLLKAFPRSVFLFNLIAQASYNNQEFDVSLDWFEKLVAIDPYRYENMDLYSNILYIKENYGELAYLAYRTFHNDKYRPETCCVIGNYYSLRGDHAKAVTYFKRAIKLDHKFLSAWTLMGHEYLEMKNTHSAIESYRTAVDIDPSDYRAWYGLGQTYEIHQMYNYAAHYYANAALARPQDSRMWCAVAGCYEKMDKKLEAAKCYERGEKSRDKEGIVLHRLAKLYLSANELDKAAKCFEENLKRKDKDAIQSAETVEAIMFLAKYYKSKEMYEESVKYATRLHDYSGPEREEANALIREISNICSHLPMH